MRIRSLAQQNVLICIVTDPADIEPNPAPNGGSVCFAEIEHR
jgi:hypothetical protein